MKMHVSIVAGAASVLMPLAIGLAGPAVAAPSALTMPEVRKISLQKALTSIDALGDNTKFRINTYNMVGWTQEQLSPANWIVCRQSPGPGRALKANSRITLGVKRPWQGC
ncbi:MAG: PASTA domain-containing protein [Mycobacterium sp.]